MPPWPVTHQYSVELSARIEILRKWEWFESDCRPLPKDCVLMFHATTNAPKPFNVFWQVLNTGDEAARVAQLRGAIFASQTDGAGGLTQKEATAYTGVHWIECFIVKDGRCVGRSGEFVVNIA